VRTSFRHRGHFVRKRTPPRQWSGFVVGQNDVAAGSAVFLKIAGPWSGFGVVGESTLVDPVLQRVFMEAGYWNTGSGYVQGAMGIIRLTAGPGNALVAAQIPDPLVDVDEDWLLHDFIQMPGNPAGTGQIGQFSGVASSGSTYQSRSKRKLGESDQLVIVFSNSSTSANQLRIMAAGRILVQGRGA